MTVSFAAKVSTIFVRDFLGKIVSTGIGREATVWNSEHYFLFV